MGSLDTVSIAILLGSLLVLAGILSSLIALRFGAPLLLVFLLVGMLAGESGIGGIKFDDVRLAYTELRAPIDGIVDVRAARAGEFLNAGQPVLSLVDPDDLWRCAQLRPGDEVRLRRP